MRCCGTSATLEPVQWSLILMQVSRGRLVCRWEQLLGANVLAHASAFCNDQYTPLHAGQSAEVLEPSRAGWTWEVHALRGDATNWNILQGSKAHVCVVTSLFHHALDTDAFGANGDHDWPFHRTYCDLIKIEDTCDGPLQHAIWLKQVRSIGVRMWRQDDQGG